MGRFFFGIAITTVAVALAAPPVQAGLVDPVLGPIAHLFLGDFLKNVQTTTNNVVDHARQQADGLVVKTANEANIFATNLSLDYKNDLQTTIENLNQQEQLVVARLQTAKTQLE
jgi:hypothetical protein